MQSFDWISFLNRYGIRYVTHGPNVAYGHCAIKCPMCRDDPSEHMGLNTTNGKWGCWRDSRHRGNAPHRLIQALLRCSRAEAARIAGTKGAKYTNAQDFISSVRSLLDSEQEEGQINKLEFPDCFRKLWTNTTAGQRFLRYLSNTRGYGGHATKVAQAYKLRFCTTGRWKQRLIIPIYMDGKLVQWSGRTVYYGERLRYMTLTHNEDRAYKRGDPVAPINIKSTVLNYDIIQGGGDTLVITEGPLDALNVDYRGAPQGIRACCVFGAALSKPQRYLLSEICDKFDNILVMFDDLRLSLQAVQLLDSKNAKVKICPANDPAELTTKQVHGLIN